MKKINLTKYGFIRTPEEDFSDDGNRFTCYLAGKRVKVSKLVQNGQVYISGNLYSDKLLYEDYSVLPHYKSLDRLNGVNLSSVEEADLIQLYNDCLAYEKEVEEAENSATFPTREELTLKLYKIKEVRQKEIADINDKLSIEVLAKINNQSEYTAKTILSYYYSLLRKANEDIEAAVGRVIGTARSKHILSNYEKELKPNWYYTAILKKLNDIVYM